MKYVFDFINSYGSDIVGVLTILGIAIDITPTIKISPIKWLLKKLGKIINESLYKHMNDIECDIQQMRMEAYEKEVRQLRSEILAFSSSCHDKQKHTSEQFAHIINQITHYEDLINKHNIRNGVMDVQSKYIKDLYKECLKNGTLL